MIRLVLIGVLLLLWAVPVQAAEVLQVRSSSLLQVGDHNRTYTVALACSAVDASQEAEATAWLRQELPRRRKVNLRPVGSSEGQLMARVTPIGAGLLLAGWLSQLGGGSDGGPESSVTKPDESDPSP